MRFSPDNEMFLLRLALPARVEHLEEVTAFVLAEARRRGMGVRAIFALELVVEELFVNVCRYAYEPPACGEIRVGILAQCPEAPCRLRLAFQDDGAPFNPLNMPSPPDLAAPLLQRRRGGLGIHLARRLTSAMSYRRIGDSNELCIEFQMPPEK